MRLSQRFEKKRWAILTILILWLAVAQLGGLAWADARITILHFNDFHGQLLPFEEHRGDEATVGGMARIAALVKEIRGENARQGIPCLFLEAGDMLQGTVMSSQFRGEPDFRCLNQMKLDAMVLGNHEFDFGQANLRRLIKLARFPMLAANVKGLPGIKGWIVKARGKLRVGIIGLVTKDTPVQTDPRNVAGLEFLDPIETARSLVPKVRQQADLVIALTHLGYEVDRELAEAVPGIDVIIGGHSHTLLEHPVAVGGTLICQAYCQGAYLGRLDLSVEEGKIADCQGRLIKIDQSIPEDKKIAALVNRWNSQLSESLKQVIGEAQVPLVGDRELVRSQETNLGNLITDVLRSAGKAEVAFINGGTIRASIDAGPITTEELLSALPFRNTLVTMDLTGAQIEEVLNRSASLAPGDGGFLQVSGVSFVIRGKQAADLRIGGQPLAADRTYRVAITDFLAVGGDGYQTFQQGKNSVDSGNQINDVFIRYLQQEKTVAPQLEGRIKAEREAAYHFPRQADLLGWGVRTAASYAGLPGRPGFVWAAYSA